MKDESSKCCALNIPSVPFTNIVDTNSLIERHNYASRREVCAINCGIIQNFQGKRLNSVQQDTAYSKENRKKRKYSFNKSELYSFEENLSAFLFPLSKHFFLSFLLTRSRSKRREIILPCEHIERIKISR